MKFVIAAVVLLAVAMGVESSHITNVAGLGYGDGLGHGHGLGLGHGHGHGHGHGVNSIGLVDGLGLELTGLGVNAHGHGSAHLGSVWSGVPAAVNVVSSPVSYAHHVAVAPHAAGLDHLAGHGATYIAKTRGSIGWTH